MDAQTVIELNRMIKNMGAIQNDLEIAVVNENLADLESIAEELVVEANILKVIARSGRFA